MESYFGHWETMLELILHELKVPYFCLPQSKKCYSRSRIDRRTYNLCEGVVEKAEELSLCFLCLVKANALMIL